MPSSRDKTNGVKTTQQRSNHNTQAGLSRSPVSTTVTKAMSILDILASKADVGVGLAELCTLIEIPKSSTHRYLVTLQELGLAERRSNDRYYLGTKVIELAGLYLLNSDLRNDCQAALDELADVTGETVHLAVPSGTEVVYIAKVESKHALSMFSHIGAHLPMHCTALGKAILAFSDAGELEEVLSKPLLSRTPNSITSIDGLKDELMKIRARGYALDNEENEIGIRCIGAPIFDYTTRPIGAISISAPRERMDEERCKTLGPLVHQAALAVSRRKGFTGLINTPLNRVQAIA